MDHGAGILAQLLGRDLAYVFRAQRVIAREILGQVTGIAEVMVVAIHAVREAGAAELLEALDARSLDHIAGALELAGIGPFALQALKLHIDRGLQLLRGMSGPRG